MINIYTDIQNEMLNFIYKQKPLWGVVCKWTAATYSRAGKWKINN